MYLVVLEIVALYETVTEAKDKRLLFFFFLFFSLCSDYLFIYLFLCEIMLSNNKPKFYFAELRQRERKRERERRKTRAHTGQGVLQGWNFLAPYTNTPVVCYSGQCCSYTSGLY